MPRAASTPSSRVVSLWPARSTVSPMRMSAPAAWMLRAGSDGLVEEERTSRRPRLCSTICTALGAAGEHASGGHLERRAARHFRLRHGAGRCGLGKELEGDRGVLLGTRRCRAPVRRTRPRGSGRRVARLWARRCRPSRMRPCASDRGTSSLPSGSSFRAACQMRSASEACSPSSGSECPCVPCPNPQIEVASVQDRPRLRCPPRAPRRPAAR